MSAGMQVLTPWYPGRVIPARAGWYITRLRRDGLQILRYWSGALWMWPYNGAPVGSRLEGLEWRGLAFDPASAERIVDAESGGWGWWIR